MFFVLFCLFFRQYPGLGYVLLVYQFLSMSFGRHLSSDSIYLQFISLEWVDPRGLPPAKWVNTDPASLTRGRCGELSRWGQVTLNTIGQDRHGRHPRPDASGTKREEQSPENRNHIKKQMMR